MAACESGVARQASLVCYQPKTKSGVSQGAMEPRMANSGGAARWSAPGASGSEIVARDPGYRDSRYPYLDKGQECGGQESFCLPHREDPRSVCIEQRVSRRLDFPTQGHGQHGHGSQISPSGRPKRHLPCRCPLAWVWMVGAAFGTPSLPLLPCCSPWVDSSYIPSADRFGSLLAAWE